MPATVLVVIDVQESVLVGCHDTGGVLGRINQLIGRSRAAGVPVVFVQHADEDDPDMAAGSRGWELSAALERTDTDVVVAKTYRSAFDDTPLDAILSDLGAERLVLAGAHSDFCVTATAFAALHQGYDVTLAADAHTATAAHLDRGVIPSPLVVDFVNQRFATLSVPGRSIDVMPAAAVIL